MYVFISILILIASILLILIVLIQNSKGGGLASGFSSSNKSWVYVRPQTFGESYLEFGGCRNRTEYRDYRIYPQELSMPLNQRSSNK